MNSPADALLWNRTGFPGFWRTGNPRRDILNSLRAYKRAMKRGRPICVLCTRIAVYPPRNPIECSKCSKATNHPHD